MLPEFLESPLDRIYDHWLRISVSGRVLDCSPRLRKRLREAGGNLESAQIRDFFEFDGGDSDRFYFAWVASLRGRSGGLRLKLAGSEGQKSHVSLMPQFADDGSVASVLAGLVDEVDSELQEEFEREAPGELPLEEIEKELRDLERTLAKERELTSLLKNESQAKSEFLASISHEIRTPLNAVIGFCDLLNSTDLSEDQKEYISTINSSGRHLINLIGQVLDFSRIDACEPDLERVRFQLDPILIELEAMFGVRYRKAPIAFSVDRTRVSDEVLIGDETRVKQVLINLLSNAFKFTREGSVSLVAETENCERTGQVCFRARIEDTGRGIEADRIKGLFDPFTYADPSVAREFGGSGLGLAICKRLCKAMDGDIWVESTRVGLGSVFACEIRLEKEGLKSSNPKTSIEGKPMTSVDDNRSTEEQSSRKSKSQSGPPRLLVVDDNPNNLLITSKLSKHLGYDAETVSNGMEALDLMKSGDFDIVLMDVRMAPINGIETTRKIRDGEAGARSSEAYIIAVTAHALQGDKEKCLASGMNDYLSKPLTLDRLQDSLNRARSELSLD